MLRKLNERMHVKTLLSTTERWNIIQEPAGDPVSKTVFVICLMDVCLAVFTCQHFANR